MKTWFWSLAPFAVFAVIALAGCSYSTMRDVRSAIRKGADVAEKIDAAADVVWPILLWTLEKSGYDTIEQHPDKMEAYAVASDYPSTLTAARLTETADGATRLHVTSRLTYRGFGTIFSARALSEPELQRLVRRAVAHQRAGRTLPPKIPEAWLED